MLVLTLVLSSDGVDTHVWIRTCEILADTLCFFGRERPNRDVMLSLTKKKLCQIESVSQRGPQYVDEHLTIHEA